MLYISSKFDSLEWWSSVGRKDHKKALYVAPILTALPSHNGFQERTFSICTWFDNPIRQRLNGARFEMTVLIAVNEGTFSCEVPSGDKAKKIVEKVITKYKEMSTDFNAEADIGVDPDLEGFLV